MISSGSEAVFCVVPQNVSLCSQNAFNIIINKLKKKGGGGDYPAWYNSLKSIHVSVILSMVLMNFIDKQLSVKHSVT